MRLAPTPDRDLNHTTEEVAERYRTAPSTVRHWRSTGTGPPFFKAGRRFLYPERGLREWETAGRRTDDTAS